MMRLWDILTNNVSVSVADETWTPGPIDDSLVSYEDDETPSPEFNEDYEGLD